MIFLIFYLTFIPKFSSAGEIEITYKDIREMIEKKNEKVFSSQLERDAALDREGYLFRSLLPSVELHGSGEKFKTGREAMKAQPTYGAEAKMNIFNGGMDKIENDIRALEADKKKFQLKRVFAEELASARFIYWEILYLREKINLLNSSIEVNKKNLESAQRRIKSGVATDSDRFEFEMKDVELRREVEVSKVELIKQSKLLSIHLGVDNESKLIFTEPLRHEHDFENLLAHGIGDHEFLFKENEIYSKQLLLKSKSSSRAIWPKIDAFASFNQFNQREKESQNISDRNESAFGIRATINLSSGLEQSYEASALKKESLAAMRTKNYLEKEINAHLQSEISEIKLLHDQVHEAEENIGRAERYYKSTLSEYSRGAKNSPDVLGASEKLFDVRHKRLEIVRDFQYAKAHILSKIGE